MEFEAAHLEAFIRTLDHTLPAWVGMSPRNWAADVLDHVEQPDRLPEAQLSRQDLFKMTNDERVGDQAFAISVLAWGGMRRNNGRLLFRVANSWLPVVSSLRNSAVDSMMAYREFQKLRAAGDLPGMRPAYFTKLIFFSAPAHDGFIMDQWTARSANLLTGSKLVRMNAVPGANGGAHLVADQNTAETYAKFCRFIRDLAKTVGKEGEDARIEEALFSAGRGQGAWRNYVIQHG